MKIEAFWMCKGFRLSSHGEVDIWLIFSVKYPAITRKDTETFVGHYVPPTLE